mgnify:CR=1 FL=1
MHGVKLKLKRIMNEYNNYSLEVKEIVKEKFIENSFYIENVHGIITETAWEMAHSICHFISSSTPELKPQITEWFGKYKKMYPTDLSLKNRLESLAKQYHFELKTMDE